MGTKVFEIVYEANNKGKEILTERHYWTAETLQHASAFATAEAHQFDKELKSVREILVLTANITAENSKGAIEYIAEFIEKENCDA